MARRLSTAGPTPRTPLEAPPSHHAAQRTQANPHLSEAQDNVAQAGYRRTERLCSREFGRRDEYCGSTGRKKEAPPILVVLVLIVLVLIVLVLIFLVLLHSCHSRRQDRRQDRRHGRSPQSHTRCEQIHDNFHGDQTAARCHRRTENFKPQEGKPSAGDAAAAAAAAAASSSAAPAPANAAGYTDTASRRRGLHAARVRVAIPIAAAASAPDARASAAGRPGAGASPTPGASAFATAATVSATFTAAAALPPAALRAPASAD
jgi:hypothetical protein